jgi:hypothetical protein
VSAGFAAVHLALRLYQLDHGGKNPANLAELVPAYIPALPRDPFNPNGGPLRLSVAPTTQPFIYSLGTSTDQVASGTYTPTLASNLDWTSAIVVSFLNPSAVPAPQPTTQPTTSPATAPILPKTGEE